MAAKPKQGTLLKLIPENGDTPAQWAYLNPEILQGQPTPKTGLPPTLTGGQKSLDKVNIAIHVDWLSITFKQPLYEVMKLINTAMKIGEDEWIEADFGSFGYRKGRHGPGGAVVWYDPPNRNDVAISLPGKACGMISEENMNELLLLACECEANCTRIDLAIDDFKRRADPEFVHERILDGELITHAKEVVRILKRGVSQPGATGSTVYIGAAASRQRLVVYDKRLESKGKIDSIRWELRCREEAAQSFMYQLAYMNFWGEVVARRFVTFADFRANDKKHTDERKRAEWYTDFMAEVGKIWAYPPATMPTMEQILAWLEKSVAPSLSVMVEANGGDMEPLTNMIREGRKRYKTRHRRILKEVKMPVSLTS